MKIRHARMLTMAIYSSLTIFLASVSSGADNIQARQTESVFTKSQPISNGFVFVDGKYLDAPYVVSRKDVAIYINDTLITSYAPLIKELPPPKSSRPAYPMEISTNAGPNDQIVTKYLYRLQNYLLVHHTRTQVATEMEEVLRALPCVKDVRRDRGNSECVIITYLNGQTENMGLVPLARKPIITPENVVEHVSRACRNYVERLEKGDFYGFSNQGGSTFTFSAGTAKEFLPGFVKVLRSSQDAETKTKQLREMLRVSPIAKEVSTAFVANLCPSKQLDKRVDALVNGSKSDK